MIVKHESSQARITQLEQKNAQLQQHLDQLEASAAGRIEQLSQKNLQLAKVLDEQKEAYLLLQSARATADSANKALRQQELQARLLKNVAEQTNAADCLETVLRSAINTVCTFSKWPVAHVYMPNKENSDTLESTNIWYLSCPEQHQPFVEQTLAMTFLKGVGMPGQVWQNNQPVWIPDVTIKADFPRADVARACQLYSCFGLPVTVNGKVEAILEFFSSEQETADHHSLFEFTAEICTMLGYFIGRKQVQKAMKEAEKNARALAQMKEAASQSKSDFLANMSHEIRTPMNAIIGMSYLALQTELSAKQQDYVTKTYNAANNLLGIINDILDFSKIEAGKMDMETIPFCLTKTMDNLTSLLSDKMHDKGLEFLHSIGNDVPNGLIGDPLRLGQILTNLGNNSVKFTDEGEVLLQTKVLEQTDDRVKLQFTMKDSGIGMSQAQIDKLFKSFAQADASTTRKYGGTGLGLTISKKLVEMMEGDIWVESQPGKGSSFIFTAVFGRHEHAQSKLTITPDLRGIRVLIVDDSSTAREILQQIAQNLLFEVSLAASGEEAIEAIIAADKADMPFKLIYMDWKLKGMDGLAATRQIKQNKAIKAQPAIVMVTSYHRDELLEQSLDIPFDGFLSKPVSASCLLDAAMVAFGHESKNATPKVLLNLGRELVSEIQGARLLLVEDNEVNQQVATELLEQAKMVVTLAENGQQAVEMVNAQSFDAVLMDIQMPVMDGYTAARTIRKNKALDSLPVIAMTANAMEGDKRKCLAAGMNDHIGKPINPKEMYGALAKWIKPGKREVPEHLKNRSDTDNTVEVPAIAGIDTQEGLQRIGGNASAYIKVLKKFVNNQADSIEQLNTALSNDQRLDAQRLAHTIKGVSGNLGAVQLCQLAGELEEQLIDPEVTDLAALIGKVEFELKHVLSSIVTSNIADDKPNIPTPMVDSTALIPMLNNLIGLLDEYDMEAEELLSEILNQAAQPELREALKRVQKQISEYDFEQAAQDIKSLVTNINEP
jgi:signal transduction histidine kinase/CheY-like chemotaxis protein